MDLKHQVQTVVVLNIDVQHSTATSSKLISKNAFNEQSYVLSDADEELIILIEFKQIVDLYSIKLFALSLNMHDTDINTSQPKQIRIYCINNLSKDFGDIRSMKPDKSIQCFGKKLEKGQFINLKKNSKNSVRFKHTKYLAIYIQSNQNNTENTHLHGIRLKGKTHLHQNVYKALNIKTEKADTNDATNRSMFRQMSKLFYHTGSDNGTSKHLFARIIKTDDKKQCDLSKCLSRNQLSLVMCQYHLYLQQTKTPDTKSIADKPQMKNKRYLSCTNITSVLKNFHHLLRVHGPEFEDIHDYMEIQCYNGKSCKLNTCLLMQRNQRDQSLSGSIDDFNADDVDDLAKQQILDKIHCHYFHSFDTGYKMRTSDRIKIDESLKHCADDVKGNETEITIRSLSSAINAHIVRTKQSYSKIEGLSRLNNQTDKFCSTLQLDDEQTEYSFGFRFFYWPYYKNNHAETIDPVQRMGDYTHVNANEIGNMIYKLNEFYIDAKFADIKDELINNQIWPINISTWNNLLCKAKVHCKTSVFKEKKCNVSDSYKYYRIPNNSSITVTHIGAMMAYCNLDKLQSKFSETYRRMPHNESIRCVIKRHTNYAHFGRLLRECVECFPTKGSGPNVLFHGITIEAKFQSLDAFIKGPVSTTTENTVAFNFCANKGMILEFQLPVFSWSSYGIKSQCAGLNLFECQYISDYVNEQEIFFIGGFGKFLIKNIITATGLNYNQYISPLSAFSDFLGGSMTGSAFSQKDAQGRSEKKMCLRILSDLLHEYYPNDHSYIECKLMPQYVKQLVKRQFADIKFIWMFEAMDSYANTNFYRKLCRGIFFYDNGWIKLELLTTVFPSLRYIALMEEKDNEEFIQNPSIFLTFISFLKKHPNTKLEDVGIAIPKKILPTAVKCFKSYIVELHKLKRPWDIKVEDGSSLIVHITSKYKESFSFQNFVQT